MIAIALLLAALIGGLAWLYASGGEHTSASADAPNASAPEDHAAPSAANAAESSESTRIELEGGVDSAPTEPPAAPVARSRTDNLRGRVVDEAGKPIAAARVSLRRGEARDFSVLDLDISKATQLVAETSSDARGEFSFTLERGVPVDLHVDMRGFCPAILSDRHAGEFVEVALSAGFLAFGRVTRARDGTPVADAKVRVFKIGGPSTLACESDTASDGRYELRFTFREGARLAVVPKVEQCSDWIELTLGPDGTVEKNVELPDGIVVAGKVTEAGTARPIVGAIVGEGWTYQRTATTDANGEYRLLGFGHSGIHDLACKAAGYGQTKREKLPGAIDGVMHVDFELLPGRRARGRVVDPSGAPIAGVLAAAIASEFSDEGQKIDWLAARTEGDGRFRIDNLTQDLPHALLLSKHGLPSRVYDFPAKESTEMELDLGTFELGLPALVAGSVEDENGLGIADVEVILKGNNSDRFRLRVDTTQQLGAVGDHYTNSRDTHTDAAGRFSFGDVAGGLYVLRARLRGRPDSAPLVVEITDGEVRDDLKIPFITGERLRGRVIDPQGRTLAGISLNASVVKLRDGTPSGDSRSYVRSSADGSFEFKGLRAGDYRLEAYAPESGDPDPDAPLLHAIVEHAATNGADIDVVLPRGEAIRGTVFDAQGAVLFGYSIFGKGPIDLQSFTTTNAAGEFSLAVPSGTVWEIEVHGAPQTEAWQRVLFSKRDVVAGTRGLVLTVP